MDATAARDLTTLQSLDAEMNNLNKRSASIRKEMKATKTRLLSYLEAKGIDAVKQGNFAVKLEVKERVKTKSKKKADEELKEVLRTAGRADPSTIYSMIKAKEERIETKKLVIVKK